MSRFTTSTLTVLISAVLLTADIATAQDGPADSSDPFPSEEIELVTADSVTIRGTLKLPPADEKLPAVILIHQGGSNRHEWDRFAFRLNEKGYITFAFDLRGHGESDPMEEVTQIYNDPNLAPNDLRAALDFVRGHGAVDPERVGVVGASIGANLAALSTAQMGVTTAVALSPNADATFNLAGTNKLELRSVFYLAAEFDQEGKRVTWAGTLYRATSEPREMEVLFKCARHGADALKCDKDVRGHIYDWLERTL